ncbi:hypothetical protein [Zavarzinia sp. CC-PAN008]|uniref:hypothetical protein n=1 Tax=Zavarzinia sp. CC-PAN008 TaxID=3243332 RepID=UPI003F743010
MDWHQTTITGGPMLQMEHMVQGLARRFDSVHRTHGRPPLAFILRVWAVGEITLYCTPDAVALCREIPEMPSLSPCSAPYPEDALFLAGSLLARQAWAQASQRPPRPFAPDLHACFAAAAV